MNDSIDSYLTSMPLQFRFELCIKFMEGLLSENELESLSNAIFLYALDPTEHDYDEELEQVLIPMAKALDSVGLNTMLPEFDILKKNLG